ncbi:hypothetical protein [Oryza sativa Japonica Group]|uniref:Uncharacterized protein n=1 Tax=Oryza sativa subsp. japonica TaxID=39947 RepID=Q5ZBS8_ORYSJ|nr:hypothetical protein [Oryza sativa Japonica Group]
MRHPGVAPLEERDWSAAAAKDTVGKWKQTATATTMTRVWRAVSRAREKERDGEGSHTVAVHLVPHGMEATYRLQRVVNGGRGRPQQCDKRGGGGSRRQLHVVLAACHAQKFSPNFQTILCIKSLSRTSQGTQNDNSTPQAKLNWGLSLGPLTPSSAQKHYTSEKGE